MAKLRKPAHPTHRAVLVTGETVDYYGPPHGAHPTHWTFGGVDASGNKDGSPVRKVAVRSHHLVTEFADAPLAEVDEDDE